MAATDPPEDDLAAQRPLHSGQGNEDVLAAEAPPKRGLRPDPRPGARALHPSLKPAAPPVDRSTLPTPPASVAVQGVVPGADSLGMPFAVLPPSFNSEGLARLRAGDYKAAAAFYEPLTRQDAHDAQAWFGLGAARQGRGNVGAAVACYARALELDTDQFPLAALVVEARPGKPDHHFQVALALARHRTVRATREAIHVMDEILASPMTSRTLYSKAEAAVRRLRKDLGWLEAEGDPELLSIKKAAAWENQRHLITRGLLAILIMVAVGAGVFVAYQRSRSTSLHDEGFLLYMEAVRVEKRDGDKDSRTSGRDAYQIYGSALAKFVEAARLHPGNVAAQVMIGRAAEGALRQLPRHFGPQGIPKDVVATLKARMQKAEAASHQADPKGTEIRRVTTYVDEAQSRTH